MKVSQLAYKGIRLLRILTIFLSIGISLFIFYLIWNDYSSPQYISHPEHHGLIAGIKFMTKLFFRIIAILIIIASTIDFFVFKSKISLANIILGIVIILLTLLI